MKAVDVITQVLSSKVGHRIAFVAMYLLLAVEYYRFVYLNYFYLMGFEFEAEPVAVIAGFFMLAVVLAVMFMGDRDEEGGSYAVSMIVALLLCLPSVVMYQFGGITPYVPLYALLFLLLLRSPLLEVSRWDMSRILVDDVARCGMSAFPLPTQPAEEHIFRLVCGAGVVCFQGLPRQGRHDTLRPAGRLPCVGVAEHGYRPPNGRVDSAAPPVFHTRHSERQLLHLLRRPSDDAVAQLPWPLV